MLELSQRFAKPLQGLRSFDGLVLRFDNRRSDDLYDLMWPGEFNTEGVQVSVAKRVLEQRARGFRPDLEPVVRGGLAELV